MDLFSAEPQHSEPHSQGVLAATADAYERKRRADQVEDCLRRGGLVLTGNARAARALRLDYAERRRRNGLSAWIAPRIHDWAGWLASLWSDLLLTVSDAPLLLSPVQEHAVWKRILHDRGDADLVVSTGGMARLAQSAYVLLSAYDAHGTRRRPWDSYSSSDAEAFRHWADSFDELCREHEWTSASTLEQRVSTALRSKALLAPNEVLLVGFDRILPARQKVLDALQSAATAITLLEDSDPPEWRHAIVAAKDLRDEIATCAHWARHRFLQQPDARLAVLVDDVARSRGEIERTFHRVLLPASLGIADQPTAPVFEFSLGRPLASVPLARAALLLLRWLSAPLRPEELTWLLLSGFLSGDPDDRLTLARVDASVHDRKNVAGDISLDWFLREASFGSSEAAAALGRRLTRARRIADSAAIGHAGSEQVTASRSKNFSAWITAARTLLDAAGWPGTGAAGDDRANYQARHKWEQLADSVAALSFDGSRVDYAEFLDVLAHTAAETIFAPHSRHAPIQIMGPLESAGQQFDAIWFLGASDLQWPGKGSTHPLIPPSVQREAGMPHATVQSDWDLAQLVTRRIAASAPECVFSYAIQTRDGAAKPSSGLSSVAGEGLEVMAAKTFLAELGIAERTPQQSEIVEIEDSSSVEWPTAEAAGGSDVLRSQAACPFRAFAIHRLGARELEETERGLDPKERGNILHDVLANLWRRKEEPGQSDASELTANEEKQWQLQSHAGLIKARDQGRLPAIVDHHIDAALRRWSDSTSEWTTAFLDGERERLRRLIKAWLEIEARRPPFAVIACEQALENVQVGDLKLNLRVDRIDRLGPDPDTDPDVSPRLLIDYKTGEVKTSAWEGERPDEPQLPLYAAYGNVPDLKGVLFAQLRANDLGFVGKVADACAMLDPSLEGSSALVKSPYSEETLSDWTDTLRRLADDFLRGNAAVTPKKYLKTCEYCALPGLCRVAETLVPLKAREIDEQQDVIPKFETFE